MKYYYIFIILPLVFVMLSGCAQFQTKIDMHKSEQLTCRAEDESLCAGWKL
jgi:hypothetical protein